MDELCHSVMQRMSFEICPYTYEMHREGGADQQDPDIEVEGVGKHSHRGVIEPATKERGPNALPQDFERLRTHIACSPVSQYLRGLGFRQINARR